MNSKLASPSTNLGALALLLLLGGCASSSTPVPESAPAPESPVRAEVTEEASGETSVVTVDRETRAVTLERADGERMTLVCGPEVRNFDRINVGDKVKAMWRMTLSVRRLGAEEPDTAPQAAKVAARAAEGAEPAAGFAVGVAMTVRVETVDAENHVVVCTDPAGARHTVRAQREEGKRFVEILKPGDRVEIVKREGVALSVE
jgi:hypothetical protein